MSSLTGSKQPTGDWDVFLGMWERANLVRAFFWSQRVDDEKILLSHFLARLRRFFGVDFCCAALSVSEDALVEVGVPEAGLSQLPQDFSRRCLESVANSRAPVTWNDAGIKLGFRTTVVVPLRAPTGASFGFLLLGQSRARSYSAVELFLLQALAGELSWVVRDLAARKFYRQKLAAISHDVKNALQVILGNAALIRQKGKDVSSEADRHVQGIEAAVELIIDRMRILPESTTPEANDAEPPADPLTHISRALTESLAACRRAAEERGVGVEVVYTPDSVDSSIVIPERVRGFLSALVDNAALATRNETVRLTVRRRGGALELAVQGRESNRVADKLKSVFEAASRSEGARDERETALARMRAYLDDVGGDVYLKSRPGEAAEIIVRLPIESDAQPARLKVKNEFATKDRV
ncbi:MAG: sensor histidine kinase [Candidatus Binatia bacterium]